MAVAGAGRAIAEGALSRRKVKLRPQKTSQKPVVTAMVVVLGINGLKHALVDKSLPPSSYWVRIAFLGLGLATLTEINPKLGKAMSYLVLTSVIFAQSQDIVENLELLERNKPAATILPPGELPTSLAALRTNDRGPFPLYFERGDVTVTSAGVPKRVTPFNDPQRPRNRPAPIPYSGSTVWA